VKGALAGGQQAMQLISVWCPYCLCHHTHGIDAAMPSWAIMKWRIMVGNVSIKGTPGRFHILDDLPSSLSATSGTISLAV
jgi:hypothetical protein